MKCEKCGNEKHGFFKICLSCQFGDGCMSATTSSARKEGSTEKVVEQPASFAPGDAVEYICERNKGEQTYISEAELSDDGEVDYATIDGAWFKHSDFKLIHRATLETLEKVRVANCEDDEGEE